MSLPATPRRPSGRSSTWASTCLGPSAWCRPTTLGPCASKAASSTVPAIPSNDALIEAGTLRAPASAAAPRRRRPLPLPRRQAVRRLRRGSTRGGTPLNLSVFARACSTAWLTRIYFPDEEAVERRRPGPVDDRRSWRSRHPGRPLRGRVLCASTSISRAKARRCSSTRRALGPLRVAPGTTVGPGTGPAGWLPLSTAGFSRQHRTAHALSPFARPALRRQPP